ncbi:hypothetical protein MHU86_5286 [Fragilaria crotonensis]|nr:hypothetical protein MHU86_5286 [Fragilaria crotonensis]
MRIANICIALFTSISATFSAASEFDAVIQPTEFRVLRGTKKHSAKRNKSHSKKGGNKLLSIPTSGDNKANSNVPDVSSCPEEKPDTDTLCSIEGQLCIFTIDTTFPGGSSTAMDECTCTTGKWICEAIMASSDIAMNACPAESPLVTEDIICDTEYPTPCTFEYTTTESSAICTNKDDCMCNGGKWACYPSTSCITTDTSNVVDSCPEDSPLPYGCRCTL